MFQNPLRLFAVLILVVIESVGGPQASKSGFEATITET
jgi:hypothetical protein